jgi:iron complex transport system substrate-binding protein
MESHKADKVKALVNIPFKDIWYLPSKESVLSTLIEDAGGEILGAKNDGPFSSQESFERMYLLAMEADVWLHQNSISSADALAAENKLFANIPAFKARRLYNNIKRVTPNGGSDYWEGGAIEPAEILLDLLQIFHPQALPAEYKGRELKYYKKLQ